MIEHSKKNKDILTYSKFLETMFIHLVKEHSSVSFYRLKDIFYVLELFSNTRFIRSQSEFWYKIEDLILRMRKDMNILDLLRVSEIYSNMGRGSQLFWEEIETLFLINSS